MISIARAVPSARSWAMSVHAFFMSTPGRHYFSADFKLRGAHSHQARLSIDMATFVPNAMRHSARLLRNPSDRFFCLHSSAMS